jgi:hypothetical protein
VSIDSGLQGQKYCALGRVEEGTVSATAVVCMKRTVVMRDMMCAVLLSHLRGESSGGEECGWTLCRTASWETRIYDRRR